MIDAIIRGSLGTFGSAILDFYIENAFLINGLLLAYALVLFSGKFAYRKINQNLAAHFFDLYGEDVGQKNENWFKKTLERAAPNWGEIARSTWIPIISLKKSFWFRLKTPQNLAEIYSPERISEILSEK